VAARIPGDGEETVDRGIELFDEGRFFEAHECFEEVWKSPGLRGDQRGFWRGVTQLAVGCCHAQRGNAKGSLAVLERAIGNLEAGPAGAPGLDTVRLIALARDVIDQVRRHGASAALRFGAFPVDRARR
jgi:predicted metal-dependent hydrolase